MAHQNEEDYLDNLLKSITNKQDATVGDLLQIDSEMPVPDTFEPTNMIEDDSVYQQMLFEQPAVPAEEEVNPMASMMSSQVAQGWSELTVDQAIQDGMEKSEDELVDEYIRNVLERDDEDSYTEALQNLDNPKKSVEYIDLTDFGEVAADDLISQLDDIFADAEEEIKVDEEAKHNPEAKQAHEQEASQILDVTKLDEELRDLLGTESDTEVIEPTSVESQFSEEELSKLAVLEEEAARQQDSYVDINELVDESTDDFDDYDEGIGEFFEQMAELGLDNKEGQDDEEEPEHLDGSDTTNNTDIDGILNSLMTENDIPDIGEKKVSDKKSTSKSAKSRKKAGSKKGLLDIILGFFQKKQKPEVNPNSNENQQVLEELFDENGELVVDKDNKPKKKGLFSKKTGRHIEISVQDDDDEPLIRPKEKKEKKPKEKKEKKPKDPKKTKKAKAPKPKKVKKPKVKPPVDPSEILTIKPLGLFIFFAVVAGITAYIYISLGMSAYNASMNNAVYHLANKRYTEAFDEVSGLSCKYEEDKLLQQQVIVIMKVEHFKDAYERYCTINRPAKALDALIKGVVAYDEYYAQAEELGVLDDLDAVKAAIVEILQTQYGITEEMAKIYANLTDSEQYAYIIESYGGRNQ